jgi:enoyl-CoA hydratase
MKSPFDITIADGIAELIFNHPPVNAFDSLTWFAIANAIDELGRKDDVRVIIVAAEGKGFCAGVDIKELAADAGKIIDVNRGNFDTFKAIHRNPKPVIVALHGFVLGGGIGISGAADIIVASECAHFGIPEVDRGAMGGGAHLQRKWIAVRWVVVHICNACSRCRRSVTCISRASSSMRQRRFASAQSNESYRASN